MIDITRTTTQLLDQLLDPGHHDAWSQFDRRYRPLVEQFARRLGLNPSASAEVAQDTLSRFAEEYQRGRYDRARGRLRSWLFTIARTQIAMVHRRATRGPAHGDTVLGTLPDEAEMTRIWESERRAAILREAMERLREESRTSPRNLRAFELLVTRQLPPAAVAEALGMSAQEVHLAKHRCLARLEKLVAEVERAYDGD